MKRICLLLIVTALISSCSGNKIIGTWIEYDSNSQTINDKDGKYTSLETYTKKKIRFHRNGKYEEFSMFEFGVNKDALWKDGPKGITKIIGEWEIIDGTKLVKHPKSVATSYGDDDNYDYDEMSGTIEESILQLDRHMLAVVTKYGVHTYSRQ